MRINPRIEVIIPAKIFRFHRAMFLKRNLPTLKLVKIGQGLAVVMAYRCGALEIKFRLSGLINYEFSRVEKGLGNRITSIIHMK